MYDLPLNQIKKIAIFYGIPSLFLIIFIAIFGYLLQNPPYPSIKIDGAPTSSYQKEIETELYYIVVKNNGSETFRRPSAQVRKDSIIESNGYYSFLVDIESLQQSYRIQISPPDDEGGYRFMVSCPDTSDLIYDQPTCQDTFTTSIGNILPAEIALQPPLLDQVRQNYPEPDIDPSFVTIRLDKSDTYSNKNKALNYQVVACGDENIISESRTIVQNWIASSGFDPDDYALNLVDDCEDN